MKREFDMLTFIFRWTIISIFILTIVSFSRGEGYKMCGDNNPRWDDLTHWNLRDFHPFVEGNYGIGFLNHKRFDRDFENYGLLEVKLGYNHSVIHEDFVLFIDERYVMGSLSKKDQNWLDSEADTGKVRTELLRFGFGNRSGYGYKLGFLSFLPFHQSQFSFTKLKTQRPIDLQPSDLEILERYGERYRFGLSTEGGIKLELFESVAFTGSYEAGVIYPRVIFFRWLAGLAIETAIVEGISHFARDIVDHSSTLGPIFYALLRNGAAYGIYVGWRDKMYWPINSETPLTYETLKFGISITF